MKSYLFLLVVLFVSSCYSRQLAIVKLSGKFGCVNRKGKIVVQPLWDFILQGDNNKQILVERDSLYGFINRRGRILIEPQYPEADLFSEGLSAVSNGKKYGFINLKGQIIIPFVFDDVFMGFNKGLSDVTIHDSCGYINKAGQFIVPTIYSTCYPFMSDYAQVQTFDGQNLLIDKAGRTVGYDEVDESKRLRRPRNSYPGSFTTLTGQGRTNDKGDTIVPPIYRVTGNLSNGMYIVQDKKERWGAYNDRGKLVIEPIFEGIWHFQEGLANFKLYGKWGYVNKSGKVVVAPKFDYAGGFRNGLAYVEINGKSGYINKRGNYVIKPKFEINEWKSNFE